MITVSAKFNLPFWLPVSRMAQLDLTHSMREIGKRLETSVIQNYNQQQTPNGAPWLPSKRAQKDGGKTLIDTGRMLASLTMISGRDFVEVGYPQGSKNIPAYLHFGVPQNNLVPREHLGLRDADKIAIHQILADYFETVFQ